MESVLVAVVGSANMDLVFDCDRIPQVGETRLGKNFRTTSGGKGANQAVAIASLGKRVAFVGCVGRDSNGDRLLEQMSSRGVDISKVERLGGTPTGVAGITVDDNGHNSIVVVPGANGRLGPEQVGLALKELQPKVVLAQLEIPLATVAACVGAGYFVLNPAPATKISNDLLASIDVITPNETETEAITGVRPHNLESCRFASKWLHDRGVKAVVLTLGEEGCYVSEGGEERQFRPPQVQAVDTTAAGDAFSGALACFLAEGRTLWQAVPLANCVAALSTTKRGAQESMPSWSELEEIAFDLL